MAKVWRAPTVMVRGGTPDYKPVVAGRGRLHGMTPAQEVARHSRMWNERAAAARARNRALRGSRRSDSEVRAIASVPVQLFAARAREFGMEHWTADPEAAAKREGVHFG